MIKQTQILESYEIVEQLQNLDTIDFILKTIKSCLNSFQLENCYNWIHNLKNIKKITILECYRLTSFITNILINDI